MSDSEIIRNLIREIQELKNEQRRLASQVPLYEIWNSNQPATIAVSPQNAYTPGDYGFLSLNASIAVLLNGMSGGVNGRLLWVRLAGGSSNITLVHSSGSAIAANRIFTPTGANVVIAQRQSFLMIYDTVSGTTGWFVLVIP